MIGGDTGEVETETLAERTGRLLHEETDIAVEAGPGFSRLPHVSESPAGGGPLAGFAAGAAALAERGWEGPVILVATDLPYLTAGMLRWLADQEPGRSVVPVLGDRPQPLCARYEHPATITASSLVTAGRRAMFDLVEAAEPLLVPEVTWLPFAGDPRCLEDMDTPAQLSGTWGRSPRPGDTQIRYRLVSRVGGRSLPGDPWVPD